jgi:hypothetical protein
MPEAMDVVTNSEENTPLDRSRSGNSVSVYMEDTLGAIFLGFLSSLLLIGWMRAEARNRRLIARLEQAYGHNSTVAR